MTYAGIVPVSPGCQAAASVFALTPMTSGCPASVFPSGFAVCQGIAPCGPTSGHGYAPAGGGVIAFARHPGFSSQSRSKTPAPIRVDFHIGSTSPCAQSALFCLGAGSGIPPAAAPSFRGVKKEKLHEVSRIEPSGQGISPEPCTTHGFGVGGSAGGRTQMSAVMSRALLPIEIRNRVTAWYDSNLESFNHLQKGFVL